jgi:hypothetical protein
VDTNKFQLKISSTFLGGVVLTPLTQLNDITYATPHGLAPAHSAGGSSV